jgi:hypothetical protein
MDYPSFLRFKASCMKCLFVSRPKSSGIPLSLYQPDYLPSFKRTIAIGKILKPVSL